MRSSGDSWGGCATPIPLRTARWAKTVSAGSVGFKTSSRQNTGPVRAQEGAAIQAADARSLYTTVTRFPRCFQVTASRLLGHGHAAPSHDRAALRGHRKLRRDGAPTAG